MSRQKPSHIDHTLLQPEILDLGTFSNRADALAAASTFAIVSDSSLCLLTAAVAVSSSALNAVLILQQVQTTNDGGGQTLHDIHADTQ